MASWVVKAHRTMLKWIKTLKWSILQTTSLTRPQNSALRHNSLLASAMSLKTLTHHYTKQSQALKMTLRKAKYLFAHKKDVGKPFLERLAWTIIWCNTVGWNCTCVLIQAVEVLFKRSQISKFIWWFIAEKSPSNVLMDAAKVSELKRTAKIMQEGM